MLNSQSSRLLLRKIMLMCSREAPFAYQAWHDPKTLAIISDIAGIELVPCIDYEIGHINFSVTGGRDEHKADALIANDDHKPIVDWHRDSYPFVCVLMMSDTTEMVGGETALRTGTGEILKVRGPSMVSSPRSTSLPLTNVGRVVLLYSKADTLNIKLSEHLEDQNASQVLLLSGLNQPWSRMTQSSALSDLSLIYQRYILKLWNTNLRIWKLDAVACSRR